MASVPAVVSAPRHLTTTADAAPAWHVVADAFLDAGAFSPHTRRAYRRQLADAFAALAVEHVHEVTGHQLATYKAGLVARMELEDGDPGKLSPASVAQAIAALRRFLRWGRAFGAHTLADEVVVEALKTPRATVQRPYAALGEGDMVRMFGTATTPRDRAILGVMLGCGLRAAEVVALDVGHLADANGALLLHVHGKGRKQRLVPAQGDVRQLLLDYLAATGRRLGDPGPLFRAYDRGVGKRSRQRLTTRALGYVIARAADAAGLTATGVSPHALRHSFALRALQSGAELVALAKVLGHASVTTTQRYVDHLQLDALRAALPALPVAVA